MRALTRTLSWLPLVAVGWALAPSVHAQSFSANYDLARPSRAASAPGDSDLLPAGRALKMGSVGVAAAFQASGGAGLSLEAGQQWFGRVGVGRTYGALPGADGSLVSLAGGYRWSDGQSLSLQLTRSRTERLGLAVRYDWPKYFVRVSYDLRLATDPVPDTLRFSAGVRF